MALTVEVIQAELKRRGLNEQNAPNFTFEDEAQMTTVLDSFKPKPKTYATPDDLLSDESLKPLVMRYGDKRVGDAKDKWDKDHPKPGTETTPDLATTIAASIKEALKPVTDELNTIKKEKLNEVRNAKIKSLLTEFPEEVHDLVLKAIPEDADDEKITTIIGETKANLTKAGIKGIGLPGGGGGIVTTAVSEIKGWGEKKSKGKDTKTKK